MPLLLLLPHDVAAASHMSEALCGSLDYNLCVIDSCTHTPAACRLIARHAEHNTELKSNIEKCHSCAAAKGRSVLGTRSAELLALDTPDCGDPDAPKSRQDVLLSPLFGVTLLNLGRTAFMAAILGDYKVAVTQIQVVSQPISHRASGIIENCVRELKKHFIGDGAAEPVHPGVLKEFLAMTRAEDKGDLADAIAKDSKVAAKVLIERLEYRTTPYMPTLRAFELLDLSAYVQAVTEETWEAADEMAERCGEAVGGIDRVKLKQQLQDWRQHAATLGIGEKAEIKKNLLRYFHGAVLRDEAAKAGLDAALAAADDEEERAKAANALEIWVLLTYRYFQLLLVSPPHLNLYIIGPVIYTKMSYMN